ncbi:sigma-E factor negative regulatory protein [soil metagenome]
MVSLIKSVSANERQSATIDGEGERAALDAAIDRLLAEPEARAEWLTAHRLGDALRFQSASTLDDEGFLQRFSARLEHEPHHLPTPLARAPRPVTPPRQRSRQLVPLALAASVAMVTWTFWPGRDLPQPVTVASAPVTATQPASRAVEPTPQITAAPFDYLVAHQQFAPSSSLQGVAPYVRTASIAAPSNFGRGR